MTTRNFVQNLLTRIQHQDSLLNWPKAVPGETELAVQYFSPEKQKYYWLLVKKGSHTHPTTLSSCPCNSFGLPNYQRATLLAQGDTESQFSKILFSEPENEN